MFNKIVEDGKIRKLIRSTYDGIRNRNLRLRRRMPYPLSHEGIWWKATKFYVDNETLQFYINR